MNHEWFTTITAPDVRGRVNSDFTWQVDQKDPRPGREGMWCRMFAGKQTTYESAVADCHKHFNITATTPLTIHAIFLEKDNESSDEHSDIR